MKWMDTTSYSKGANVRDQNAWTFESSKIRISVLNRHRYYPNKWIMHCHRLNISEKVLDIPFESSPEEAQQAAVAIVRKELLELLELLK